MGRGRGWVRDAVPVADGRRMTPRRERANGELRAGTLAVVMVTYNGAEFVEEQLASIRSQTVQPDLLVISDDGSSDDTVARCHRMTADWSTNVVVVASPPARCRKSFTSIAANV